MVSTYIDVSLCVGGAIFLQESTNYMNISNLKDISLTAGNNSLISATECSETCGTNALFATTLRTTTAPYICCPLTL